MLNFLIPGSRGILFYRIGRTRLRLVLIKNFANIFFYRKNYTQRVAPKINKISSHSGGTFGNKLRVEGTGFSKNLDNFECEIAGQPCSVSEA